MALKLTQKAFAQAVGVSRTTVVEWEREGSEGPADLNRARIQALLDRGMPEATKPDTTPRDVLDPVRALHVRASASQSEWLWRYTLEVMEAMTARYRSEGPFAFDADDVPPGRPRTVPRLSQQRKAGAG